VLVLVIVVFDSLDIRLVFVVRSPNGDAPGSAPRFSVLFLVLIVARRNNAPPRRIVVVFHFLVVFVPISTPRSSAVRFIIVLIVDFALLSSRRRPSIFDVVIVLIVVAVAGSHGEPAPIVFILVLVPPVSSHFRPNPVVVVIFIPTTHRPLVLVCFVPLGARTHLDRFLLIIDYFEAGSLFRLLRGQRRRTGRLAAGHGDPRAALRALDLSLLGIVVQIGGRPAFGADGSNGHGKT
jgi:hypothetical protein